MSRDTVGICKVTRLSLAAKGPLRLQLVSAAFSIAVSHFVRGPKELQTPVYVPLLSGGTKTIMNLLVNLGIPLAISLLLPEQLPSTTCTDQSNVWSPAQSKSLQQSVMPVGCVNDTRQ